MYHFHDFCHICTTSGLLLIYRWFLKSFHFHFWLTNYLSFTLSNNKGFPDGSRAKEFTCNVRDAGLIPGSERSPREGNGYPFQYSCLENPMNRGAWWATVVGSQRVGHDWTDEHKGEGSASLPQALISMKSWVWYESCMFFSWYILKYIHNSLTDTVLGTTVYHLSGAR